VRQFRVTLARLLALADGRLAAELGGATPLDKAPGRFYLALPPAGFDGTYLRQPAHPILDEAGGPALELPVAWAGRGLQPGDELDLLGPCGRASSLPEHAYNVLLIAGPSGAGRLLPLASAALARRAAVTLVCAGPQTLRGLPAEVEVRFGLEGLGEMLAWAQAVYAHLPPGELRVVQALLRAGPAGREARAYCLPPAPCGVGACGACAVPTRSNWRLACLEGPWVDLVELEV
jgi:dihydroorotate dehydrogenase electron transfer subunit